MKKGKKYRETKSRHEDRQKDSEKEKKVMYI